MYICICNAVNDRQIRSAVEHGAKTMRQLVDELGICKQCGTCGKAAKCLLADLVKNQAQDTGTTSQERSIN